MQAASSKEIQKARSVAKRSRVSVACSSCKATKVKCSDFRPCKRCSNSEKKCEGPSGEDFANHQSARPIVTDGNVQQPVTGYLELPYSSAPAVNSIFGPSVVAQTIASSSFVQNSYAFPDFHRLSVPAFDVWPRPIQSFSPRPSLPMLSPAINALLSSSAFGTLHLPMNQYIPADNAAFLHQANFLAAAHATRNHFEARRLRDRHQQP